ncbi:MAG: c-type cytochrome [Sandaracinus sp.]|nr:c-type cytochrome [Sandaracinus sp.]MCB9615713.1 c-type cytochrome [Sandaracinus sp.]
MAEGKARRPWWKRVLIGLGVLLLLLGVAGGGTVAWAYSNVGGRFEKTWEVSVPPLEIPTDEVSLARGEHLARHVCACVECHGDDLGGRVFVDDPALGRAMGANLTRGRGGRGQGLEVEDWQRALLHGVGTHGRSLQIMPAEDYTRLSARDLGSLIAWARSVPNVDRETSIDLKPLAYVLAAAGELPFVSAENVDHDATLPPHVEPGPTFEYGEYLARMCVGCHSQDLGGQVMAGAPPGTPEIPSLRGLSGRGWAEADFEGAIRHGRGLGGRQLHDFMPFRAYSGLHDPEVTALWSYLQTLQ